MPHFQLDREPVPNRKKPTKWDSRDMLKKTATVVTSSNRKDHLLTISSSMNSTSSPKTASGKKLSTTLRPTSHRDHRPAPYALQVSLKVLPFELPASSFAPSPWTLEGMPPFPFHRYLLEKYSCFALFTWPLFVDSLQLGSGPRHPWSWPPRYPGWLADFWAPEERAVT